MSIAPARGHEPLAGAALELKSHALIKILLKVGSKECNTKINLKYNAFFLRKRHIKCRKTIFEQNLGGGAWPPWPLAGAALKLKSHALIKILLKVGRKVSNAKNKLEI